MCEVTLAALACSVAPHAGSLATVIIFLRKLRCEVSGHRGKRVPVARGLEFSPRVVSSLSDAFVWNYLEVFVQLVLNESAANAAAFFFLSPL